MRPLIFNHGLSGVERIAAIVAFLVGALSALASSRHRSLAVFSWLALAYDPLPATVLVDGLACAIVEWEPAPQKATDSARRLAHLTSLYEPSECSLHVKPRRPSLLKTYWW